MSTATPTPPTPAPNPGELAEALGRAVLEGLPESAVESDPEQALLIIERTAAAERQVRELLRQSVLSGRAAGHSWTVIGNRLGMSKQAAQQRFGDAGGDTEPAAESATERRLGPVTAFDELAELELAGRLGWHTVGCGHYHHRVIRTATQWQHRRVLWSASAARTAQDGWQVGARAFPWVYLVRDTGLPAEPE